METVAAVRDLFTFYAFTTDAPRAADTPALGLCFAQSEAVGRQSAVYLVLFQLALEAARLPFFLQDTADGPRLLDWGLASLHDHLPGGRPRTHRGAIEDLLTYGARGMLGLWSLSPTPPPTLDRMPVSGLRRHGRMTYSRNWSRSMRS